MKPEILTLCEYASEHNGQLTIVDTFDAIAALKFPWRAYFYVAAKIDLDGCDIDYKTMSLCVVSKEEPAKPVFEASSKFARPDDMGKLVVVAGLKGLIFESAGEYCFRIKLDNTTIAEYPFKVSLRNEE